MALFALLCLSKIATQAYAQNNSTKAVGAKLSQRPADGYSGAAEEDPEKQPYGADEEPYDGGYQEPKCPDGQPADSVKDGACGSCIAVLSTTGTHPAPPPAHARTCSSPLCDIVRSHADRHCCTQHTEHLSHCASLSAELPSACRVVQLQCTGPTAHSHGGS